MSIKRNELIQTIENTIKRYDEWKNDPTTSTAWEIHTLLLKAAHGNDAAYSKQQVEDMFVGIRRFISEYPA
jgi:hypothetical protein